MRAPSELGAVLQIRRFLDSTVMVAGSNICEFVMPSQSQMGGQTEMAALQLVCASGRGGPQRGSTDAGGRACKPGGTLTGPLELL